MVLQNGFSVSLYNPDTKLAYKEFQKGNDTYIGAEPGAQYFVDIQLVDRNAFVGKKRIQAHLFVDEQDIGYRYHIPSNGNIVRKGLHSTDGDRALAFALSRLNVVNASSAENGSCNSILLVCGQVIVCFHGVSIIYCGAKVFPMETKFKTHNTAASDANEFSSRNNEMSTIDVTTTQEAKLKNQKVMRCIAGTATVSRVKKTSIAEAETETATVSCDNSATVSSTEKASFLGQHVTTVTLNYCSTVGLIMVGVLEKPYPEWNPMNGIVKTRPTVALEAYDKTKDSVTTYHDSDGLAHEAILVDLTDL